MERDIKIQMKHEIEMQHKLKIEMEREIKIKIKMKPTVKIRMSIEKVSDLRSLQESEFTCQSLTSCGMVILRCLHLIF